MSKVTVSLEVDISKLAALQAFLTGDIDNGAAAPPKKKSTKKPVDEEPVEEEEGEELDMSDLGLDDENVEEEETIDADAIRAALKPLVKQNSAVVGQLNKKFKIQNVSGLKPAQFQPYYDAVMALRKKLKIKE